MIPLTDDMGFWTEDGDGAAWLSRVHQPDRTAACRWYAEVTDSGEPFTAVRCRAVHCRLTTPGDYADDHDSYHFPAGTGITPCDPDHPDAHPFWELEWA